MTALILVLLLVAPSVARAADEQLPGLTQQPTGGMGQIEESSVILSPSFSTGPTGPTSPSGIAPVFGTGVPAHFRIPPRFDLGWDERFLYPQKETSP